MDGHGESKREKAIFYYSRFFVELKWIRPRSIYFKSKALTSKFITLKLPFFYHVFTLFRARQTYYV